jgi:uncharacterized protein (DUF2267 family)
MSYQAVVAFFSGTGKVADRPPNLLPYAMIQAVLLCQIPVVLRNLFLHRPRALEPRRQRKAVTTRHRYFLERVALATGM